ncbi:murein hydrolase regulator LrgB [Pasteurella canis]|uniref:Murein hydrolase regulator LrgB n=1 Tax=Pasteurella canis TaxID=753 RepID=A0A379EUX4_9PAST|nr:CidB/LrgB family autolysis modulator [Pasteurella canis]UDW84187.1 CidB/LrgB family autolysis modulator [Pasteurella canis]SUC10102.1 murein hydrolase regulator LrgB [Pasteurella canis]
MNYSIYLYSVLTLVAFGMAIKISQYWKSILFNSFVLTMIILIIVLLSLDISYDQYLLGNTPLNNLLGISIVALAVPLYEQLHQISRHWQQILSVTFLASLFSMISGAILAFILGATPDIVATVLPKSVTTPIAMAIAESLGGIPSIAAVGVVLAGLQGSVLGLWVLRTLKIKHSESLGLAIGSISHALGTVTCMESDQKAGSYSSIALVLCGIITSILAPITFKLIYFVMA